MSEHQAEEERLPETENIASHAIRFPAWVATTVFSIVSLIALVTKKHELDNPEKYSLLVIMISFVLGFTGTLFYLKIRHVFMGGIAEMGLASFLVMLWASGLAVILNPNNSIAVTYTTVTNANLYFSSWGGFLCSLWIIVSLFHENVGFDVTKTPPKTAKLFGLVASSMVVLASSIRIFLAFDCNLSAMSAVEVCKRTKFSIAAGVIGFCFASILTCASYARVVGHAMIQMYGAGFLMLLWCFGLAYITFGEGPGHSIGNLYFATWASLSLSLFLFAECFQEYQAGREASQDIETVTTENSGMHGAPQLNIDMDIEVEDL
jgi:hypothetical protein